MAESFEVVTAALTRHARTLTTLSGELNAALSAAGAVCVTGNAYGQIGQRFAAALEQLAKLGQETLRDGVAALDTAGETMRETAAAYERGDAAGADRLAGLESELG